jgi:hypothetical protein
MSTRRMLSGSRKKGPRSAQTPLVTRGHGTQKRKPLRLIEPAPAETNRKKYTKDLPNGILDGEKLATSVRAIGYPMWCHDREAFWSRSDLRNVDSPRPGFLPLWRCRFPMTRQVFTPESGATRVFCQSQNQLSRGVPERAAQTSSDFQIPRNRSTQANYFAEAEASDRIAEGFVRFR